MQCRYRIPPLDLFARDQQTDTIAKSEVFPRDDFLAAVSVYDVDR
jgi:hypothetical protein